MGERGTLSATELAKGVELVLGTTAPPYLKESILSEAREGFAQTRAELRALDRSFNEPGGAAFLWEDVLALSDAYDLLRSVLDDLSPERAAGTLLKLVLTWRRVRQVRVMLDAEEFEVLLAIKRGSRDVNSIAARSNLTLERAGNVVEQLRQRHYKPDVPLVETSAEGLTTRF